MPVRRSVDLPNGVTLPYVESGDASGTPLLLLHAIADSWRAFEPLLPHLPLSIRAIVPTQRGHGDASKPAAGYAPRDFTADLAAFMDEVHLDAAVIAGGSSGGVIARRFAIDHPDRTRALALIGSPFRLRDKPGVKEIFDRVFSTLTDPIDPGFVRGFLGGTLARRIPDDLFETLATENLKVPAHVWKATMQGLLEDGSSEELGAITAATLIAWGDADTVVTRSDQEALAEAIPRSRLVVYPGAGHAFYWEEPDRIATDLATFIEEIGQ